MADKNRLAIETVNLTKVFKDFWRRDKARALDNLNLRVQNGSVHGLLGPNGSGKSTAIKLMLGLLFPTQGSVAILGRHPRNLDMKSRIGYMPEESYLYRFLNAEETLDFYGRLFKLNATVRRNRVARLLDMVGLTPHRKRALSEYSKGMARRIGLAQALINDPELVMLDEPTTGMDPIGTREIKDLILEPKGRGKTVLLCSHLLSDVEDVCDDVTILYGGKVRSEGPVGDLLTRRGQTQITTDSLPEELAGKIEAVLREAGIASVDIHAPRERLEAYFLRVIEEARRTQPVTSGAMMGTGAAKFFEADDIKREEPESVLGRLVSLTDEAAPAVPTTEEVSARPVAKPSWQQESVIPPKVVPAEPRRDVLKDLLTGGASQESKSDEKSPFDIAEEERKQRAKDVLSQLVNDAEPKPETDAKDEEQKNA